MNDYDFLNFELIFNNDGNARYEFRERRFNQSVGYIIVKDGVITMARSFFNNEWTFCRYSWLSI